MNIVVRSVSIHRESTKNFTSEIMEAAPKSIGRAVRKKIGRRLLHPTDRKVQIPKATKTILAVPPKCEAQSLTLLILLGKAAWSLIPIYLREGCIYLVLRNQNPKGIGPGGLSC